jgi:hypothetical protein
MKNTTALLSGMFLAASLALGVSSVQAEGVILRDRFPGPNCCARKFPVVHVNPLSPDRPTVKDAGSAAILNSHRACDYDPVNCCPYFCEDVVAEG